MNLPNTSANGTPCTGNGGCGNGRPVKRVGQIAAHCQPGRFRRCDGSREGADALFEEMAPSGMAARLDDKLRPNGYLSRPGPADTARAEGRASTSGLGEDDAVPANLRREPRQMRKTLNSLFDGRVRGGASAREAPQGWTPRYRDMGRGGPHPRDVRWDELAAIDRKTWPPKTLLQEKLFLAIRGHLPKGPLLEREPLICR